MSPTKLFLAMLMLLCCLMSFPAQAGQAKKISPAEGKFWGMGALHSVPFDIKVLSSEVKDGIRNDEIYYTSELGKEGKPVRVYAYLAGPVQPKGKTPLILMIHGGGGTADKGAAPWMAGMLNAYVLSLDWAGPFGDRKKYTLFDAVMDPKVASDPTYVMPDLSDAALKHITRACLRGVDLLLAQKSADPDHILAMGGSWGGFLSLLTSSIDHRITTVSGAYGGGYIGESRSFLGRQFYNNPKVSADQRDYWLRYCDPCQYVGKLPRPIQMVTGSNDRFFWLACNAKTYEALPRGSTIAISPNTDHTLGSGIDGNWTHWFKTALGTEPAWPAVKAFKFNGKQASWLAKGPSPVTQSVLCFSPGHEDWPGRCWLQFPAQGSGPKFSLELPAWAQGVEGDAYAMITDQLGRVITTLPLHVKGKSLAEFSNGRSDPGLMDNFTDGIERWRASMYVGGQTLAWRKPEAGKTGALEVSRADGKAGDLGILTNTISLAAGKLGPQGSLTFEMNTPAGGEKLKIALVEHTLMVDERVVPVEWAAKAGAGSQTIEIPLAKFVLDGKAPDWTKVNELRIDLKAPDKAKYAFAGFRIK